jgi:hypothetical protein
MPVTARWPWASDSSESDQGRIFDGQAQPVVHERVRTGLAPLLELARDGLLAQKPHFEVLARENSRRFSVEIAWRRDANPVRHELEAAKRERSLRVRHLRLARPRGVVGGVHAGVPSDQHAGACDAPRSLVDDAAPDLHGCRGRARSRSPGWIGVLG